MYDQIKPNYLEIIQLIYATKERLCIYYNAEDAGFLVENGALLTFSSIDSAQTYLKTLFPTYTKPVSSSVYDFTNLKCIRNREVPPDPCYILDIWNLMDDLARSLAIPFLGQERTSLIDTIYDKLFFGNNLPTINTSGKTYTPVFSVAEQETLYEILQNVRLILEHLPCLHLT